MKGFGKRLYAGWMAFGHAIGIGVSTIILGVMYFTIFAPFALIYKSTLLFRPRKVGFIVPEQRKVDLNYYSQES